MAGKKDGKQARAAEIKALREAEKRRERRGRLLTFGIAGVVVAGLVAAVWVVIAGQVKAQQELVDAASGDIKGVEFTEGLSANHIEGIDHSGIDLPPVGGDHSEVPLTCGVYTEPVPVEHAIHSLEHGAVWVAYQPDLPADQVAILDDTATGQDHVFVAPFPGLRSPVVLTGWGVQLQLESANDPRLPLFMTKYVEGPQTPEPGAPCEGTAMQK